MSAPALSRVLRRPTVLRGAGTVALVLVAALVFVSVADASFTKSVSGGPQVLATGSLAAPTGLGATCSNSVAHLTWTQTSSIWADGYEVLRGTVNGGPYAVIATVVGRGTTTYNDATVNGSSIYYYVVRATKQLWRSGYSNQVTVDSSNC
jgi:hypothetical protein